MYDEEYIDSLDIPESDRGLLHRFNRARWADIIPGLCVSATARDLARWMAREQRGREEYSLDMQ